MLCCRSSLYVCISTSSFHPIKPLRLNPTSKYCKLSSGTAHTVQIMSPSMKKGTLIYYPSSLARRRVYFDIPVLLLPFPPYRDLFSLNLHSNPSQRILFPFLRGGDRILKMDEASSFWKDLPPTIAHTYTHLRSVALVHPDLSR